MYFLGGYIRFFGSEDDTSVNPILPVYWKGVVLLLFPPRHVWGIMWRSYHVAIEWTIILNWFRLDCGEGWGVIRVICWIKYWSLLSWMGMLVICPRTHCRLNRVTWVSRTKRSAGVERYRENISNKLDRIKSNLDRQLRVPIWVCWGC